MPRRTPQTRLRWSAFALASLAAVAALAWVTRSVLALERDEATARAEAARSEQVRLALWRLDSWMAPKLAAEAARPYFHYLALYPTRRAYDQFLSPIADGEVLTPSPLLGRSDEIVKLHVQVDADGHVTSPQVPVGTPWQSRVDAFVSPERRAVAAALLDQARIELGGVPVVDRIGDMMACQAEQIVEDPRTDTPFANELVAKLNRAQSLAPDAPVNSRSTAKEPREWADNDYAQRLVQSSAAQVAAPVQFESGPGETAVEVGPFVPIWIAGRGAEPSLYYFRRVSMGSAELAQGLLVDWPVLEARLLEQVEDVMPGATIEQVPGAEAPSGATATEGSVRPSSTSVAPDASAREPIEETRLASIPARLVPGDGSGVAMPTGVTPTRGALGVAWLSLVAAIVAAGLSLRAVAADAERRARFAGVVTHELRTPLTTFQLYTDMLVDGMAPPERRGEYLLTLRDESHRLGHLVENVLSYARLEQGRHAARLEPVTAAELVARVLPALRRRAESAGMSLDVESPVGRQVAASPASHRVDVECVERILFNLIDNAAKYAVDDPAPCAAPSDVAEGHAAPRASSARRLVLHVGERDGTLQLAVVDHGRGVPESARARLFRPFERGGDDRTQQQRGIGLGLALSRELAVALGGDLRHEQTPGGGATFRLTVGSGAR